MLGNLKPREWRYLNANEVAALKGQPGKTKAVPKKARHIAKKPGESRRPRRIFERGKHR
jgi:hypothetical protein